MRVLSFSFFFPTMIIMNLSKKIGKKDRKKMSENSVFKIQLQSIEQLDVTRDFMI